MSQDRDLPQFSGKMKNTRLILPPQLQPKACSVMSYLKRQAGSSMIGGKAHDILIWLKYVLPYVLGALCRVVPLNNKGFHAVHACGAVSNNKPCEYQGSTETVTDFGMRPGPGLGQMWAKSGPDVCQIELICNVGKLCPLVNLLEC